MTCETEYTVFNATAQGWQMAQDRYEQLTLWQRIWRKPLADQIVVRIGPALSTIKYATR